MSIIFAEEDEPIRDTKEKKTNEPGVPSFFVVPLLAFYILLGYCGQLIEDEMPSVILEEDLSPNNFDTFSEESALRYHRIILGDQPRVAGLEYHLNKTYDLKDLVDEIARGGRQRVLTDWQLVSGDYFLGFTLPYANIYQNVSNIIAVLEGESGFDTNGSIGSSVLVNCHYDSVPYAMGASDNAVFCSVMAEILNKFSKRPQKFKHNIVFLFNGAEENPLQGSHGFLKHPWAKGVKSVVNLDAAGMNGKPAVFQATDSRVLSAFQSSVNRPNAQSVGEALFSSGIIPSDTDFRIFRDFGQIQGMDIAFSKWACVYHTRYDIPDLIKPGVIQNAGNMLLDTLETLADLPDMDRKAEASKFIYYDYLNLFMVSYSQSVAYIVDAVIIVVALVTVGYFIWIVGPRWSTYREFLYAILGRIVAIAVGALLDVILTLIMVATTEQLRYLSHPWIVVPIFWIPYLIGAFAAAHVYDSWRNKKVTLSRSTRVLQSSAASRLLLCLGAVVLMFTPLPAYIITVALLIMSVLSLVTISFARRLKAWQHLILYALLTTPSVLYINMLSLRLDAIMLPIMGRSSNDSPDYLVGGINLALALLMSSVVSGIELLFSRRRLWLWLSGMLAACIVIMFIPFEPYSDDGPATMRHYWFNTEIVTVGHNHSARSSGVMFSKLDANFPVVTRGSPIDASNCIDYVFCGLPLYRPAFAAALPEAKFISAPGPAPFTPPPSLTSERECTETTCTYHFHMIGTAHNTITLWPLQQVNVTSWSLESPATVSFTQLNRPVYIIIHSKATFDPAHEHAELDFTVDIDFPPSMSNMTHYLDVSHHSHKIQHPQEFTAAYRELVETAPHYYNIASFLTFRKALYKPWPQLGIDGLTYVCLGFASAHIYTFVHQCLYCWPLQ